VTLRIAALALALAAGVPCLALDYPPLTPDPASYKARREKFMAKLPPKSVAVLRSAPMRTMSNDVEYLYRQDSDFYYLTGIDQDDLELAMIDHGLEEMGESSGEKGEPQLVLRCAFASFGKLQEALEARKLAPLSAEHEYIPNVHTELPEPQATEVLTLIDLLEQDDDVQHVFHTLA